MIQTRRELLDDFLGFVTESGDSVARDLAERLLNRALLALWMRHPWQQYRAQPYQVTTVAGQADYALPPHFGRMAYRDGRVRNLTHGAWLFPATREALDTFVPTRGTALESRSTPTSYVQDATIGVSAQPSLSGEACEVLSSDSADTTVRVYVEGFDADGRQQRTQVTLSGTTPKTVGTWARIERFAKSYPAGISPTTELTTSAGAVTLRTTADKTVLQTLLSDEAAVDLPVITFYPTPDSAITIGVPFLQAPRRLLYDADPLPRFWGNALFEELTIQWAVNKGQLTTDAQVPRPHLADLIALETANRVPSLTRRQPFGGWR